MRVIVFSRFPRDENNPRGGVESATLGLLKGLVEINGLDVHVVTLEKGISSITIENHSKITVHRLPDSPWPMFLDILGGPGKRRLMKYIDNLNPDVVHFQETYGLVKPKRKYPCVFTLHGFDSMNLGTEKKWLWPIRSLLWKWVERYGLSTQTDIVSINPYVTKQMKAYTKARIYPIENAISKNYFEIESNEVSNRVFFAGWINPRKNLYTLVKAINKVRDSGIDVMLHAAGEASDQGYKDKVLSYINENNLTDCVELLGRVDQECIRRELSQASVFVLPSYQENAPMAIAEAMAIGVPVISTTRCGMPYMIEEGSTGFLVQPDDYLGLANKIIDIIGNHSLRASISENCKAKARKAYHPDSVAGKTHDLYQKLLSEQVN